MHLKYLAEIGRSLHPARLQQIDTIVFQHFDTSDETSECRVLRNYLQEKEWTNEQAFETSDKGDNDYKFQ